MTINDVANNLHKILSELKIKKVYYIDDVFDGPDGLEDILPLLDISGVDQKKTNKLMRLIQPIEINDPLPVVQDNFKEFWSGLGTPEKDGLKDNIYKVLGLTAPEGDPYKKAFLTLFKTGVLQANKYEIKCLTPSDWEGSKTGIFNSLSDTNRILCLFDLDLAGSAGYSMTGPKSGIGLLSEFIEQDPNDFSICAVISSRISLENEVQFWENWVKTHFPEFEKSPSKFLTLSKDRLNLSDHGYLFSKAIQYSGLNYYFNNIKVDLINSIKCASELSVQELDTISLFDFEHIILKSSTVEGVWEAETAVRLYDIIHEDKLKNKFISDDFSSKFNIANEKATKIRKVISSEASTFTLTNKLLKLRNQELYEHGPILNGLHSHLRTGDIFQLEKPNGELIDFILIGQPCDLMVRADKGKRKAKSVDLVLIEKMVKSDYEENKKNDDFVRTMFPLHYYNDGSDDVGVVKFAKNYTIRIDVLDLAVLNNQGTCTLDLSTQVSAPKQFHQPWIKRFNALIKQFTEDRNKLEKYLGAISHITDAALKSELTAALMPTVAFDSFGLPSIPYKEGIYDFKLKRIRNYRFPNSTYLLSRYMKFLSREAEEHDFAAPLN